MSLFAQDTRLVATPGNADALVARFAESAEIQRHNPSCELLIVGKSSVEPDVVHVFEVWSSEEDWEAARSSPVIEQWARDMATFVSGPPMTIHLTSVAGKGLRTET
jgi:quinol monooxygenase YgiN